MGNLYCFAIWNLAGLFVFVCGCGNDLASLKGSVTIDGNPAPEGLAIEFCPLGEGSPSYGTTDENGQYEAAFTFQTMGIEAGEHRVKLLPSQIEIPMPKIGLDGNPIGPPPVNPMRGLPRKYYQEIEQITIEPGKNTHDIVLSTE